MSQSTLDVNYQTTVPDEVRRLLGVRPGDVLQWEVAGGDVRVKVASPAFLELQGAFKVGNGIPSKTYEKCVIW